MNKYIISMLVSNQAGVLTRISGMFGRRGFNISSLAVCETENPEFSRMTITMLGEDADRDQSIKQLQKLHDVYEIKEMHPNEIVSRELALIKIKTNKENRQDIMDAVNVFRSKIIDFTTESICVEMTGETDKIEAFVKLVEPFGIIELCRTGIVSLDRGSKSLKKS